MTTEEMIENHQMAEVNHAMMDAKVPMPEPMLDPQNYPTKEYRPSNAQALKEFEIMIKFLDRGCIVHVGCKSIAFQHAPDAIAALNDYFKNPYEEQKRWRRLLD